MGLSGATKNLTYSFFSSEMPRIISQHPTGQPEQGHRESSMWKTWCVDIFYLPHVKQNLYIVKRGNNFLSTIFASSLWHPFSFPLTFLFPCLFLSFPIFSFFFSFSSLFLLIRRRAKYRQKVEKTMKVVKVVVTGGGTIVADSAYGWSFDLALPVCKPFWCIFPFSKFSLWLKFENFILF